MNTYIIRFFSNFALAGFYPFLSVWLLETTEMSSLNVSIIISVGIFMSRVGSVLLSKYVNYYNKRSSILLSSFLIILVIALMDLSKMEGIETLWVWFSLSVIWGITVSVVTLAILAFIADQTSGAEQQREFANINIALSLSAGVGPIAGATTLAYYPDLLPLVPIIALAFSIMFTFRMPTDKHKGTQHTDEKKGKASRKNEYAPFVVLCIINFLTFMSYSQFINIFPNYANEFLDKRLTGVFFFISSLVVAVTQIPLNRFFSKIATYKTIMAACLFSALGTFFLIGAESQIITLCVIGVILFSVSQAIYTPLYQQLGVELFPGSSTYALALIMLMWGLGEGATVIIGFYFIDEGIGTWSYLLGGAAALAAIPLAWVYKKKW